MYVSNALSFNMEVEEEKDNNSDNEMHDQVQIENTVTIDLQQAIEDTAPDKIKNKEIEYVSLATDYMYRPNVMDNMSVYEFISLYTKQKNSQKKGLKSY